jgi:hypothetical protein
MFSVAVKGGHGVSGGRFDLSERARVLAGAGTRATLLGVAAVAVGFAVKSVGTYASGSSGRQADPSGMSIVAKNHATGSASRAPVRLLTAGDTWRVRVASLEPTVDASAEEDADSEASFETRFILDQPHASFDERFSSAAVSRGKIVVTTLETEQSGLVPPDRAAKVAHGAVGDPESDSAARPPVATPSKKAVRPSEAHKDPGASPDIDSRTAIYDIGAHVVYLPDGRRLEAHSGFGAHLDDARFVNVKHLGPTPPNVYNLALREQLFHGVRAIRLVPVGDGNMYGRDGMLAHSYMLGPNGQSNGCVSFNDYPAFLNAFLKGEVDRLVVVENLAGAPTPREASGSFLDAVKRFFKFSERGVQS